MTSGARATIVVGFDGSLHAEAALRWASRYASETDASVTVVHAVGLLEHAGLAEPTVDGAQARAITEKAGLEPSRVEWRREDGAPCAVLRRIVEADPLSVLVVVGSRGSGAHAGSLLGSTSLELAQRCPVPLVIVPRESVAARTA